MSGSDVQVTAFLQMDSYAGIVASSEQSFNVRAISAVAFALLYYDFALTFTAEVELFWVLQRPSAGAIGFFLNRYLGLLGHVLVILELYGFNSISMSLALQGFHQMYAGVSQLVIGGLQIARVYALWNCNRVVLCLLGVISVIVCIISGWTTSHTEQTHCVSVDDDRLVQQTQCDPAKWRAQGYYLAVAWAAALLFDATVFSLTVYRVLKVGEKCKGSLFSLLLRDGALYFGVLLVCHVANILACIFAPPAYRDACVTIANVYTPFFVSSFITHFH